MSPNIHEEKIRILQKQLAETNKKLEEYNSVSDIKRPHVMRLSEEKKELKKELDLLLDDCKELKGGK